MIAMLNEHSVAYMMPGGEAGKSAPCPSQKRPVDLVHLARQTFGDRNLEQEILSLFSHQAAAAGEKIRGVDSDQRQKLAHWLRGSANTIGAFSIAELAKNVEEDPANITLIDDLVHQIKLVRSFIASVTR